MSRRISNSQSLTHSSSIRNNKSSTTIGTVVDVVLNSTSLRLRKIKPEDADKYSTGKYTSDIGACVIRPQGDVITSDEHLELYKPLNPHDLDVPLVGEVVELVEIGGGRYYRRLPAGTLNTGNARINANKDFYPKIEPKTNTAEEYNKTAQTGIAASSGKSSRDTQLGSYFQPQTANPLILYEGDKVIQSRFGQSIRFSAYNNPFKTFAPTIHIRNGQSLLSRAVSLPGDLVEEDVNADGSTILMTSGNYLLPFSPGTATSRFFTKPNVFTAFPLAFKGGDQMLLNSGRIIISSKTSEMLFYSKGNYGFVSDGIFSIDNGRGGANLDFNGNVRITTNGKSTYILGGGNGNIYLNIENKDEPLVRGNTLKDLMERLIDLIVAQVYQTPSGPTAVGPTNQADFRKIKSELSKMLSTLNFTE